MGSDVNLDTPGHEPQLLSATVRTEPVAEALEQLAAAVHEYVRVYRHPPRYLVLHPADAAVLLPHVQRERASEPLPEERTAPLTDRVCAELARGALLLSDTEDPTWEAPADGPPTTASREGLASGDDRQMG